MGQPRVFWQSETGMPLPSDAKILEAHSGGFYASEYVLVVTMPSKSAESWISRYLPGWAPSGDSDVSQWEAEYGVPARYHLDRVKNWQCWYGDSPTHRIIEVLCVWDDPERALLFMNIIYR